MNNPKFQVFQGGNNQYYFRLRARNGQIILASQGYTAKQSCFNGIESVKANAPNPSRFDRRNASNGQYYFVLQAANHQIIGMSELYTTAAARDNGIESVMANAPNAPVEGLT
jgi:uncharacterized protein YegP (UPF0339 family)